MAGNWHEYQEVERHWRLFDGMINHLGIQPADLARHEGGRTFRIAADRCMVCPVADACESWLGTAEPTAPSPSFCPLSRLDLIRAPPTSHDRE